ncbi:MAG TPA: hypothetical protein VE175_10325 [Woeseiaceae bacterium]|nr:hypothetical protein [Woeseiaceae bacterium]
MTEPADSLREAYRRSGPAGYWRRNLEELQRSQQEGSNVPAIAWAKVYDRLGDKNRALALLNEAFEERSGHLIMLQVGPRWEVLREDPRFQEIVQRMNFPK